MLRPFGPVLFLAALAAIATACTGGNTVIGPNDDDVCRDVGFCNADVDVCACDTTCMRIGADHYTCQVTCAKDEDCTKTSEPITGAAFTKCVEAEGTGRVSRGSYCQ